MNRALEVTWSLTFSASSRGDLQQYLRVADEFSASTNWDRVGDWRVSAGKPARDTAEHGQHTTPQTPES